MLPDILQETSVPVCLGWQLALTSLAVCRAVVFNSTSVKPRLSGGPYKKAARQCSLSQYPRVTHISNHSKTETLWVARFLFFFNFFLCRFLCMTIKCVFKLQRRLNFPFCSWEDMQVCRSVSSQAKTMSHSQFESRGYRRVHWDPFLSRGTMQRVLSAVKLLSEPNKGANCQCCRLDPCTLLWWWHLYLCLCQTKLCHTGC